MKNQKVKYETESVDGLRIFYREAGPEDAQTILLLHGFPTSSHMFRDLMMDLKHRYHVVAPDYPGFGYSDAPAQGEFDYSFDNLSDIIEKFIIKKGISRFYLFMQDYGSPVGFRIAARNPKWIDGLIIQNANAYMEGVGEALAKPFMPYWQNRNAETEAPLLELLSLEGTKFQFTVGTHEKRLLNPDAWMHAQAGLDRPDNRDIQLTLFYDYQNNIPKFSEWQKYFREHQPPTLITWGVGDPFFIEAGAKAYLTDLPKAKLHLLNTGHFALEEKHEEIADLIVQFIDR